MKKITVVSGGRADWGLLSPVCRVLKRDSAFNLHIVATGQHLMNGAATLKVIEKEGFEIGSLVDMGLGADDSDLAITVSLGKAIIGFASEFDNNRPDLLLVLGDRYEILGAVQAALIAKIPVAHLCGGDVTQGAMDDAIRHAITKMSHLHFVSNEDARGRVIQMGEKPEHVYCVGNSGLDHISDLEKMNREEFFNSISFKPQKQNIMVTFHPVTLEENSLKQCQAMLNALDRLGGDVGIIITGSNADPEGQKITKMVKRYAEKTLNACFHESLGSVRYLNALRHVDAVVGNSSSGLYEAPSFGVYTVNIGSRQQGRIKAPTVIDCTSSEDDILKAIQKALMQPRGTGENPYGDGHAAERIIKVLKKINCSNDMCRKTFVDFGG